MIHGLRIQNHCGLLKKSKPFRKKHCVSSLVLSLFGGLLQGDIGLSLLPLGQDKQPTLLLIIQRWLIQNRSRHQTSSRSLSRSNSTRSPFIKVNHGNRICTDIIIMWYSTRSPFVKLNKGNRICTDTIIMWCPKPSQPQGATPGSNTNVNPSSTHSAQKSQNRKSSKSTKSVLTQK